MTTVLWNSGNPAKLTKHANTTTFARNPTKYVSVQHIWNLSWLLGLFTCPKLENLSWNFVTACTRSEKTFLWHHTDCEMLFVVTQVHVSSYPQDTIHPMKMCFSYGFFVFVFSGIFLLCFIACFSAKFASKFLAKSAVFYANLSLQITRNLTFFPVIRSLHLCTVMHSALKCTHKWLNKT